MRFLTFPGVTDSPVSATPMPEFFLNGCMPDVQVCSWSHHDARDALRGGSANMITFVTTMFLLPLGLGALYLYVSGAFTKTSLGS